MGLFLQDGQTRHEKETEQDPIEIAQSLADQGHEWVAGVHFKEDLTCEEASWQKTFERQGIEVSVVDHGIGTIDNITDIFCDHISDALDVIPL